MYAWIWRHLPFGLPGRLVGSLLIVVLLSTASWLWVFPWLDPLLPFDDVRVELPADSNSAPAGSGSAPGVSPTDDPYAIPYSTVSNEPAPTPTSSYSQLPS